MKPHSALSAVRRPGLKLALIACQIGALVAWIAWRGHLWTAAGMMLAGVAVVAAGIHAIRLGGRHG